MKRPREDRAAYQASQSLFDALRTATARLDRQKAHLAISRDLVQRLHVKLRNDDDEPQAKKHKRYIDCAVKAWQDATESFTEILRELTAVSGPDPTEGRKARPEYGAMLSMFETARSAKEAANDYHVSENVANVLESELEMRPASNHSNSTPSSAQRMQIAGQKRPSPSNAQELDVEALQNAQKFPRLHEHTVVDSATEALRVDRDKRETNGREAASELPGKQQKSQTFPQVQNADTTRSSDPSARDPDIQYEDVSAELDARLKAKEARKKATKAEKKRKRESMDSLPAGESLRYGHEYAKMEAVHQGKDEGSQGVNTKPPKKKQKNQVGHTERVGAKDIAQSKAAKRKQDDDQGDEAKVGRKKRRRQSGQE